MRPIFVITIRILLDVRFGTDKLNALILLATLDNVNLRPSQPRQACCGFGRGGRGEHP